MCKLTKDALYTHTYIQATLKSFYMRSVAISEEHNSTFSPIWQHSTKILVTFHHPENCILKWWVFSLIYLFILLMWIMQKELLGTATEAKTLQNFIQSWTFLFIQHYYKDK